MQMNTFTQFDVLPMNTSISLLSVFVVKSGDRNHKTIPDSANL